MRPFFRDQRGAAAVEFALVAPFLVIGVLSTADLGFEISSRMEIDQGLRAGAEAAIDDPGEAAVLAALSAAETGAGGAATTTWTATRFCACAEVRETAVSCFSLCADDAPTSIYYRLSGDRPATPMLLPRETVSRDALVQVR